MNIKTPGIRAISEKDKKYLEENYKTYSDPVLAYQIGCSKATVYRYRAKNNLKRIGYAKGVPLKEEFKNIDMNLNLNTLQKEIENALNIEDLGDRKRNQDYIVGRSIFFSIAKDNSTYTLTQLGKIFKYDRVTVLNSLKKLDDYLEIDSKYKNAYKKINPKIHDLDTEEEVIELRKRILELEQEQRFKSQLKPSHECFSEILNQVPEYHIETVMMRLKPIVKMLEKPSRHNHLSKYINQ